MRKIAAKLGFVFWGIRGFGIMILLSYPTLGAAFALAEVSRESLLRYLFFSLFHFAFGAHIYLFNDLSDARLNPEEPGQRNYHALKHPEIMSEGQIQALAYGLLAVALLGFYLLSPLLLGIGAFCGLITLLYSHPRINCKGVPVVSTLIHFCFATLYFVGGWLIFQPFAFRALALGVFFGLVLSGGHFSNEIEDFRGDLRAGIRTNAIAFGQRRVFRFGVFLFLASSIYGLALGWLGLAPRFMIGVGGILAGLWVVQAFRYRRWQGGDSIRSFRRFYRVLYALVSLAILLFLLAEKV